jgi:hypothetical protein
MVYVLFSCQGAAQRFGCNYTMLVVIFHVAIQLLPYNNLNVSILDSGATLPIGMPIPRTTFFGI